ncbi:MAG: LacI family DNA-binding transcriptional regulator, partial [Planctomycetaceae bacterium]
MKSSKPTSRDIAYEAGVSQATVSRALRNSPLVRAETRQKIVEIAAQLNYRVDKHAAGLRTRQSRTLALLLFEDPTSDDSQINPFFLSMLGNVTRAAADLDYDVLVSFQQLSDHWHARYEASHRADGIILLGYGDYVSYAEKLQALADAEAHFIIWGPRV